MNRILLKVIVLLAVCFSQALLLPAISFGQYGPSDYVLSTQAQVDAFDPSVLQGKNLVISGTDISNISRLTNLIRVNGLVIENNPLLSSLAPLNNVDSVKGPLRIEGNSVLSNIDGFSSLKYVNGLTIANNASVASISGFNSLLTMGPNEYTAPGSLIVQNNQSLVTISGFKAITRAANITIDNNSTLTGLTGFQQLARVAYSNRYTFGILEITNNAELTNLEGFLAITALNSLKLSGNSKLKNVHGLSNWTQLYGTYLEISNNAVLEDLDGLSSLTASAIDPRWSSGAAIYLNDNPLLTKPCGIHKLLDQVAPFFDANSVHIEGSGFHLYQLIECGTPLPIPPPPIIALDFNQGTGIAPVNAGILGANFSRSVGIPLSSNNFPVNVGAPYSFDFGTAPGNHYVESSVPIDGLKNLSAFTLTGWLNCKSNAAGSGGNRIISWIKNGGEGVDLVYQSNGSLRLGVDGWPDTSPAFSSAGKVPTSSTGAANNWIFFAVTYQSNGQVQFYFGNSTTDATLDVTRSYAGPGVTGSAIGKLAIGSFNDATRNASTYDRMFRGLIDDVQIYSASLNYEKILAIQHAAGEVELPSKPNPVVASKTSTSVTLQWADPTTGPWPQGYSIYKDGALLSNDGFVLSSQGSTNAAVIARLSPATAYTFVVRAAGYGNNFVDSDPLSVTTNPAAASPLRIEAENYNASSGVVKRTTTIESTDAGDWIRFDNVNLGSGYSTITARYAKGNIVNGTSTVRLGNPTTGPLIGTLITGYTGGWATFTTQLAPVTGGTGLQTIYVSWPSGEGNGNFDWFEFSGVSGVGDITPPTAPSNLALQSKTSNSITLNWTAATDNVGVTLYEVYDNQLIMGTSTTTAITLDNLTPNTVFNFRVRAKDFANNYSIFSNNLQVNLGTTPTLRIEAESHNGASGIVKQATTVESTDGGDWIRFDNVNLGNGYTTIATRYAKGNNVNGTATIRLSNPTTGTLIGTLNTSFTGGWGTFTTTSAPLTGGTGLQTVYVSWPSGSGNGNFDWFELSSGGQSSSGRMNTSVASAPVVLDEEEIQNELLQNYPNPFSGGTTIGVSLKRSVRVAKIAVYDLSGRSLNDIEVIERGKTTVEINGGDMNSGVYVYSLIVDGQVIDMKRMAVFK